MIDWDRHAKEYWDDQPHPLAPSIRIGDFATAVKLATKLKFGGHANAAEAAAFWPEFLATGMSPENFLHAVDRIAPLAFSYHGRPPSMQELVQLSEKSPREARSYFADLPDQHYPHVSAGDMVKTLQAARPYARRLIDREPTKNEAAYLYHSGEHPRDYYQYLADDKAQKSNDTATLPDQNVVPLTQRGLPGGGSVAPTRGSQVGT